MTLLINLPHAPHDKPRPAVASRRTPSAATRCRRFVTTMTLTLTTALSIATAPESATAAPRKPNLDHSGRKQVGWASYYAHRFSGRLMADGTPMRPESNNAASRTLPLGTMAQVTNLRDGKTALVTIRDRGPFVKGRIIDLSPRTARQLGFVKAGVVQVSVTPLRIPQPDGTVKAVMAMSEFEPVDTRCVLLVSEGRKAQHAATC